jgi:hypothetical protein
MRVWVGAGLVVAFCASGPAWADVIIKASFGGIVDDGTYTDSGPVNTSYTVGQAISGSFVFDATTSSFTSFSIGGYTAAPGYTTIFSPPLTSTGYGYLGVENPVANSAPADLLQINFYYETTPLPSTATIASFIANPGSFSQDLSGTPSYFAVDLTNANGTNTEVDGLLTSYVATLPEPGTLWLALPALAACALIRRRTG